MQVGVVDSNNNIVPTASNNVTFSVSGPGFIEGCANGDPSGHVNNKVPYHPAYHGLVMCVVRPNLTGPGPALAQVDELLRPLFLQELALSP
jgi:beta-galactosidase